MKENDNEKVNIQKSVVSGLFWKFIEVLSGDGVSFIVSIVLARLLMPEDFGQISLVNIFITLANVFVVYGLGTALIQKKDSDSLDFSSTFYFNLAISIVLYFILFFTAPAIADWYNSPNLVMVLRALGLKIPIASITTIQNAYISKHMHFKKSFAVSLIGTGFSGVVGIVMAFTGFGVWALVGQVLSGAVISVIIVFFVIKWHPTLEFSFSRLKGLISYGWKLLVSGFIKVGYDQLSGLIIGKVYTTTDLAYYSKGRKYPELVVSGINTSIGAVLFPVFSKKQDDRQVLKSMVRKSISITTYIMSPLLLGLAALAEPLVLFLLTDKWIFAVPYMQIACIYYLLQPVQTANLQAIRATGRSDIILKLDIIKRGVGLIFILCFMYQGVIAIAFAPVVVSFVASIVNVFPNRKLIGYSYKEQMLDLLPNLFISIVMAVAVWFIKALLKQLGLANILIILIGVVVGMLLFLLLSLLFKNENLFYIIDSFKDMIARKEKNDVLIDKESK